MGAASRDDPPHADLRPDVARGGAATHPGETPRAAGELVGRAVGTSGEAPTAVKSANPEAWPRAADERRVVGGAGATANPGETPWDAVARRALRQALGYDLGPPIS